MKFKLLFITLLISLTTFAQKEINIEDAAKHVGDSVKICSKVYGGKYLDQANGSPTFLNVGAAYPNSLLTIVIWNDVRKQFAKAPEEFFTGKEVCMYGKIEMYRGKPQIVISNPNQLQESVKVDVK